MNLLEECLEKLLNTHDKCEVLVFPKGQAISDLFFEMFPFSSWGQIDWEKIKTKAPIKSLSQIDQYLERFGIEYDVPIYVIWGDNDLPVIQCKLNDALINIDDITPVGMYGTWLFCPDNNFVIEFYHEGDITIGFEN